MIATPHIKGAAAVAAGRLLVGAPAVGASDAAPYAVTPGSLEPDPACRAQARAADLSVLRTRGREWVAAVCRRRRRADLGERRGRELPRGLGRARRFRGRGLARRQDAALLGQRRPDDDLLLRR